MIGIYKITSPSKKIYIGQSVNIEKRWKAYKNLDCKKQIRLYNSFIKYGVENHKFEILIICEVDQLNIYEQYYQELYECTNLNGLNCKVTYLEDRSGYVSKETKFNMSVSQKNRSKETNKKISISLTGKKHKEETKNKIREKNIGKKASNETKLKISISHKNLNSIERLQNSKSRKKWIIDTSTNIKYLGAKEASLSLGHTVSSLHKKLSGSRKNNTTLIYL